MADRRDKSEKNKNVPVSSPARSFMFAAQDEVLATRHEILKENHKTLKQDYACLELRLKHVQEMNELVRTHHQNQINEQKAREQRLIKVIEAEKAEKAKIVEEVKGLENELRVANEARLILEEELDERLKKMEDKHIELTEKLDELDKEYSCLKTLCEGEDQIIGQEENNEMIVVDEYPIVNNNVTDAIVISDDSDDEYDNSPRECNMVPHLPIVVRQEEEPSNGANPLQVNHPSPLPSSSSSSSDDEFVLVPLPAKRSRNDYDKL